MFVTDLGSSNKPQYLYGFSDMCCRQYTQKFSKIDYLLNISGQPRIYYQ